MKLKKLLPILFPLILTACEDSIGADNRFHPATIPNPARTVLVEEYTGTSCVNCPNGHEALEALEEYYNTEENLSQNIGIIVVGIHIPKWGIAVENGGFITPEAADMTPQGITPPQAQVNRSGYVIDRADWAKEISIQIGRTPQVLFPDRVSASIKDGKITVSGRAVAAENIGDARIHAWIVEDNITFRQSMPDGTRKNDYVHQNVYRAHMTASYAGEDFALTRNQGRDFSFSYPIHDQWNTANLRAIIFIEKPSDGVLNATQAPILSL